MKIEKVTDAAPLGFPYIAYLPDCLPEHPALVFHLHGAGERGDGTNLDVILRNGFPQIASDEVLQDAILVMPQCPEGTFWAAKTESLKLFMDRCVEKYCADADRIYVCGLSMGGYGTWYMAMAYPDYFAAIAPCCGGGMTWNAAVLKMPIRCFHGTADPLVMPTETLNMAEAVRASGGDVCCTLYDGVGHDSWFRAFSPELMQWLLSKKRRH